MELLGFFHQGFNLLLAQSKSNVTAALWACRRALVPAEGSPEHGAAFPGAAFLHSIHQAAGLVRMSAQESREAIV